MKIKIIAIILMLTFLVSFASAACPNSGTTCKTTGKTISSNTVKSKDCTASFTCSLSGGKYYIKNTSKGNTNGCYYSFWQCDSSGKACKKVKSTYECNPVVTFPKGKYLVCLSVKCKSCNCWVGPAEARITV
jgi:hypothetical protein